MSLINHCEQHFFKSYILLEIPQSYWKLLSLIKCVLSVFRKVKFSISFIFFQQILQKQTGKNNADDPPSDEGSGDNDDDDDDEDDDDDDDDDDNEISEEELTNTSDSKKIVLSTVNEFINVLVLPVGQKFNQQSLIQPFTLQVFFRINNNSTSLALMT